jgi:CarD family transcriptional regulator
MAEAKASLQFEVGDPVVHPAQGAGTVSNVTTFERDGEPHLYYSIHLIDDSGMLMVPADNADDIGLRRALYGVDQIHEQLFNDPEPLADHYRTRHAHLRRKLKSGDPIQVAQAVRDLAWREHVGELTKVDNDLFREGKEKLVGELAAKRGVQMDTAAHRLNKMLGEAISAHAADA